ncbi:hypothetical protein HXX76_006970 [Chlamydomonas incerta]|uniref:Expansin-like EG45 domain-containing protein n=1 Tax=Chlamydomonas incerta TaxID=51695 RepID=A0A835SYY3_CHLIN|nr:hypothetical protein HXX76_006970 [Chlamydomonas incerta]|eukprot:KAG2435774.1 hypothetical protein HXX76_006970 [Chlamydomonas incerta]
MEAASRIFDFAASVFGAAAPCPAQCSASPAADLQHESRAGDREQQHQPEPSTSQHHPQQQRGCRQHATSFSTTSSAPPAPAGSPHSPMLSALLAGLLLTSASFPRGALADDGGGWMDGRATYYGNDGGATIDQGSCMYGGLPNGLVSTGTDIAAMADANPAFAGSCGRCYEVACREARFSDGYGNGIDRSGGTCSRGGSVIVTITDACPCYYPANEYSNKRWCCGDMNHLDLSYQAFSKIADLGQGVIGIRYRQVACPGYSASSPRSGGGFVQGAGLWSAVGATIDQGSCMYGGLPSGLVSTGTDIAAMADANPAFAGSCG